MKTFAMLVLTGCAVVGVGDCDSSNSNYYVIEMPPPAETPAGQATEGRPFTVYWNVPTMQCASKRISFAGLQERYGIVQNAGDAFRGDRFAILYDPGLFPAMFRDASGDEGLRMRNGGVPQRGDLHLHLDAFRTALQQSVPDEHFDGVGVIDFESWRPVFRQNFGVLTPYRDESVRLERERHWWWPDSWVHDEARKRFEESARSFMQTTLSVARQLRPRARWGYYGFPYCFNMQGGHMDAPCPRPVPAENDRLQWLWSESGALFPSVYSAAELSGAQLAALVRGRVREAARVQPNMPVLPYYWYRYRDAGFMSQADLNTVLETLYASEASGFIIWGSSGDVNTVDKCLALREYVHAVLGPSVARYTRRHTMLHATTTEQPRDESQEDATTAEGQLDPEPHWNPPLNNTSPDRTTNDYNEVGEHLNSSVIIHMILNALIDMKDDSEDNLEENVIGPEAGPISTTPIDILIEDYLEDEQMFKQITTKSEEYIDGTSTPEIILTTVRTGYLPIPGSNNDTDCSTENDNNIFFYNDNTLFSPTTESFTTGITETADSIDHQDEVTETTFLSTERDSEKTSNNCQSEYVAEFTTTSGPATLATSTTTTTDSEHSSGSESSQLDIIHSPKTFL